MTSESHNLTEYEGHVDVEERPVTDVVAACGTVSATIDRLVNDLQENR